MRINHNMNALSIFFNQTKTEKQQNIAFERITTGIKINNSSDDPSGIVQSESMRMQIRGLSMAARNAQDGVSMLQTAEGGMDSIQDSLQRLRELIVSSGDASKNPEDKENIQLEIEQIKKGINDAVENTNFNGIAIIKKDETIKMKVGSNAGDEIQFSSYNFMANNIGEMDSNGKVISGSSVSDVDINSKSVAENLKIVDGALDNVTMSRAKYGALENRFSNTMDNVNAFAQGVQEAESDIRDADISEEMMEYTKDSVLAQAGNAMLAQANKFPMDVVNILSDLKSR